MPFDMRDLVTGLPTDTPAERRNRQIVAGWLFTIAAMVWAMTVLGGATRLTGSGLSIMEWAPLAGVLPPLSHAEWERLFALYRQIPQYSLLHDWRYRADCCRAATETENRQVLPRLRTAPTMQLAQSQMKKGCSSSSYRADRIHQRSSLFRPGRGDCPARL